MTMTQTQPVTCHEYVATHHHLRAGHGDRGLDPARGAGLAIELATLRRAPDAGIDAHPVTMPVPGAGFYVVTSLRGIWGTTEAAVAELLRPLRPGGRAGLTAWGQAKASPGAWALAPFRLVAPPVVARAAMVTSGRPGVGEELLARHGLVDVRRVEVPFSWEFSSPEAYVRALLSTGPAYEAVQQVGEVAFREAALADARERVRQGLPLRARIAVAGFLARKPGR